MEEAVVLIVRELFVFPVQRPTTIVVVVVVPFVIATALSGRNLLLLCFLPFDILVDIIAFDGVFIPCTFFMIHTSAVLTKRSKHQHALSGGADEQMLCQNKANINKYLSSAS
jgi:hypothetical protein